MANGLHADFLLFKFTDSIFLGMIAASSISGTLNPDAKTFLDLYVLNWFNVFGVSVGIFTISICAYLASIYSLREASEDFDLALMIKKAKQSMLFVVIAGILVFVAAYFLKFLYWKEFSVIGWELLRLLLRLYS